MTQRCDAIYRLLAYPTMGDAFHQINATIRQFFSMEAAERAGLDYMEEGFAWYDIEICRF